MRQTATRHLWQYVAEIEVRYANPIPKADRLTITSSYTAYDILLAHWEREHIDYREQFLILYLNRANEVLGLHRHTSGGIAGVVVESRHILGIALKANASGIILSHNHPSGSTIPSDADREITRKIRDACKLLDLSLLDHIILTKENYYSFADEGQL